MLSQISGQVIHALLTRAPLYSSRRTFSFDLHVLGTPPAFVLSQDQTLQFILKNLILLFTFLRICVDPQSVRLLFSFQRPNFPAAEVFPTADPASYIICFCLSNFFSRCISFFSARLFPVAKSSIKYQMFLLWSIFLLLNSSNQFNPSETTLTHLQHVLAWG